MPSVIPLDEINQRFPNIYISRRLLKVIEKDGLITPVLIDRDGTVWEGDIDRYEAFCRLADSLTSAGNHTMLVCCYSELTKEDLLDLYGANK